MVGGGVAGLATAAQLAREGMEVAKMGGICSEKKGIWLEKEDDSTSKHGALKENSTKSSVNEIQSDILVIRQVRIWH